MKVLVIGGGGREHAIVDALSRSPQVEKIYCAPGNAGIARQAECVAIRETEVERLRNFAAERGIGLTVVGPEVALAAGVVDCFRAAGLRIFGPTKAAAIIILGIAVIVVFVSDKRYMQFVWIAAAGAGMMALFLGMESYRLERIAIWKNPEAYEKGYQTIQGLYAIGSGGLFGRGFGESIQKLGFVPEAQNDMIFSIICEELGFVGATILMLVFLVLIWRFMELGRASCRERV